MVNVCCSAFGAAADDYFTEAIAARDLASYRQKGPGPTARLLLDGLAASQPIGTSLLDVGAGIGGLTFELLERGIARAVLVDASSAYLAAAADEAERRHRRDAIDLVHGDFVTLAPGLGAADVVVLDRVICCYPEWMPLLEHALRHADRSLALSYPMDRWYVRLGMALENWVRTLRRKPFRVFVHSPRAMERLIQHAGFALVARKKTWIWAADAYARRSPRTSAEPLR